MKALLFIKYRLQFLAFHLTLFTLIFSTQSYAEDNIWSKQQLTILKSLQLDSTKIEVDETNAVVNNPTAIKLGHKLFFDTRFSKNGNVSCASCHQPKHFFSDSLKVAKGIQKGSRNTPSIIGASRNTWFFHDGRSDSLWSQALGPLENTLEHGGNRNQFAHLIFSDPLLRNDYTSLFGEMPNISNKKRFPQHATPVANKESQQAWQRMTKKDKKTITDIFVNIGKVIAAYETQLQPSPSRFDNYVEALTTKNTDEQYENLSTQEINGLRLFITKGNCITCHSGSMLTDNGFHNISIQLRKKNKVDWGRYKGVQQVIKSPFNCRSEYNDNKTKSVMASCDELDYIISGRHETFGAMKTPSLRNVSKTAPYMHAGQFKTLKDVLQHYDNPTKLTHRSSALFIDIELSGSEIEYLVAFLKSLDSEINTTSELLKKPDYH